jgi:hypothetical protein
VRIQPAGPAVQLGTMEPALRPSEDQVACTPRSPQAAVCKLGLPPSYERKQDDVKRRHRRCSCGVGNSKMDQAGNEHAGCGRVSRSITPRALLLCARGLQITALLGE